VHLAKGRGEVRKVESQTLVATGVLEKDGATSEKKVKGGANTSSRSGKGASSTTLGNRGREDA